MSLQPPKIDKRTYQDIVNQTEELAKKFTDWRPRPDGKPDAGMAMIRIFGRMAALVSDRLNQVPDKNFLAFLDLIGTHLLPPQPAKVPLTFSLAQGSPVDALVPAHTQIAAPPAEGQEEVVFETDQELVVTTAQLQAVFVREPEKDKYSDRTLQATGKKDAAFEAFAGEQPIEHCLYLACDELFTLPANKTITLKFNSPEATSLATLPINWSYWDGSWQVLNPTVNSLEGEMQVVIPNLPVLTKQFINGIEAGWLKASLNQSLLDEDANIETTQLKVKDVRSFMAADSTIRLAAGSSNQEDCKIISVDSQEKTLTLETALKYSHPKESSVCLSKLPTINRITVSAEITKNDLTPDFCFFNTVPIDLSKDFYPFGEQPRFNDTLYIASKEAFARGNTNVTLTVTLSEGLFVNTDGSVEIAWEVWNGQNWQKLETNSTTLTGEDITNSKTLPANFTGNGKVKLTLAQANFQTTVNGETNYWLRARLVKGNFGAHLSQATTIAVLTEDSKTKKELTVNSVRGFMPNDRVQIVSGGQNPESCEIESSDNTTNKLTLKTELRQTYLRGTSVMLLSDSVLGPPSVKSLTLSYSYEASRSLSACCAYNDFHYVEPLTTELREKANFGQKILKLASVSGFAKGDRLWIDNSEEREIEAVDLEQRTVTVEPALAADHAAGNSVVLQSFQPFKATADRDQTLYLGFDKPFANRPTSLFAQVEPPQPKEVASQLQTNDTKPVQLVWEYASPSGWSRLGVKDETSAFAERGLIQFIGPRDMIKTSEFGQELYWLRVRWQEGQFRVPPRLRRLLTNTMWATQATTLKEEILGSSDGNPKQIFGTVQKPVLKGQQLEVQEAKIPSPEEHAVIRSLEGDDAVNIVRDETGQIEAVWVRWHNVRDFYGSGPHDRHYVLDRLTGEVQFGDGQFGMVPPQGRNNIRLSQYQTGGGTQGNLAANTVVQLKTTVPYVQKVTNLEAAGGGAEQESLEQVKERGPKFLRHRGRAVTWQDFEDLAYEASPDVARAKAIAPSFDPLHNLWIKDPKAPNLDQHKTPHDAGQIRMLIVPRSLARQPVPSLALIDRVTAYVRERCDPSVNLQVTGPEWQAVSVTAEVVPVSLERADTVRVAVVQHLENFLHPLSGGKKGQGWVLGRLPQPSDVYAVIESIPGVDHVQSLKIEPDLEELSPEKLVYSGTHTVTSILPEEGA
jgi:predicted phage baseplate assembly protein